MIGVDLSEYQANVNLHELSQHVGIVIVKATEGTGWVDSRFHERMYTLRTLKIKRGAYHFAHPAVSAVEQAKHFLATVHPEALDRLVCDIEVEGSRNTYAWFKAFRRYVRLHTISVRRPFGKTTYPYSDEAYFNAFLPRTSRWGVRNWKANIGNTPRPRWLGHQFSWTYRVPGVGSPCDASYWRS